MEGIPSWVVGVRQAAGESSQRGILDSQRWHRDELSQSLGAKTRRRAEGYFLGKAAHNSRRIWQVGAVRRTRPPRAARSIRKRMLGGAGKRAASNLPGFGRTRLTSKRKHGNQSSGHYAGGSRGRVSGSHEQTRE